MNWCAMQVGDRNGILLGVLRNPGQRLFDAVEEAVAETGLLPVEPVAGLLEIERCEGRKTNGPVHRGDGGNGRRARRSARTSAAGRAALASASNVASRSSRIRRVSGSICSGSSVSGRRGMG